MSVQNYNEQILQKNYLQYMLVKQEVEKSNNDVELILKLRKAESVYFDTVLKTKFNKEKIDQLEKEVEEKLNTEKKFTQNYKESILKEIQYSNKNKNEGYEK